MLRWVCLAVILQFALSFSASACEGQTGKVIYDDDFSDDSGGWDLTPPLSTIKPPALVFTLNKGTNIHAHVVTFQAKEADFCLEGRIPKSVSADNDYHLGLEFWALDYANVWLFEVSAAAANLWHKKGGEWQNILKVANPPGFKPDAANTLRVKTLGGKITVFLNGQLLKAVRAQIPDGDLHFGAFAETDKAVEVATPVLVTRFTVTAGQ